MAYPTTVVGTASTLGWVATDWTIDSSTGAIRYIGDAHGGTNPSYVTVIDFHRALGDYADQAAASGDDLLDISSLTPSDRSTDNIITLLNGFNIDQTAAEHLYDGSIIQNGGDDIYDGVVNFGNAKYIIIHQNGAILNDTLDFFNTYAATASANYTFPPENQQAGISHNFLVQVRSGGTDIDGRYLLGTTREFGFTYAEFTIQGTSRGNNVLALSESDDLNNDTGTNSAAVVGTWDQFANDSVGYDNTQDVDNNGTPEAYYSRWDIGGGSTPASPTINNLYEYTKYVQRRGTAETLYGLGGDLFRGITHQIPYTSLAGGNFAEGTLLDIGAVTGAAMVLADNGTDTVWIQLLKLSTPLTSNPTLTQGGVTATATSASIVSRSVSATFIGQSTGSAIIGAYGVGIDAGDLKATDKLTDLGNSVITPPNNVQFTVSGLVSGEDRVLVAPATGGVIDTTQLTLAGTLNGAAVTSVVVNEAIPSDTPSTGTIRVINDQGFHVLLNYSSFTGSTFTISSYDFSGADENDSATAGNGVYITYIDKLAAGTSESFTVVYSADRPLFVRVRDGGTSPIKTFETPATLGDAGGSVSAIRTSDV